jgi:hypothetical protein
MNEIFEQANGEENFSHTFFCWIGNFNKMLSKWNFSTRKKAFSKIGLLTFSHSNLIVRKG